MHFRPYMIFVCAAVALAVSHAASAGEGHSHSGHAVGAVQLILNNGAKWQTDKALRDGMQNIRHGMEDAMPRIQKGSMSKDQYVALADLIQGQVDHMVADCKLPPEADAQLHIVLAKVIESVEIIRKAPDPTPGALNIRQVLDDYGNYFEHPGWAAAPH